MFSRKENTKELTVLMSTNGQIRLASAILFILMISTSSDLRNRKLRLISLKELKKLPLLLRLKSFTRLGISLNVVSRQELTQITSICLIRL